MSALALRDEHVLETRIHRLVIRKDRHVWKSARELADVARSLRDDQRRSSFENIAPRADAGFRRGDGFFDGRETTRELDERIGGHGTLSAFVGSAIKPRPKADAPNGGEHVRE